MIEIIITFLLNYIVVIIGGFVYVSLGWGSIRDFVQQPVMFLIFIYYLIVIFYLLKKNKRLESYFLSRDIFLCLFLGISLSVFFNMIIFKLYPVRPGNTSFLILQFILSGIIGPVYEELLFRYIFYNRLLKIFSKKISIFINILIFGLIHFSFIKSIYASVLGFFFIIVYEKKKNILAPIFVHIGANSVSLFLNQFDCNVLILSFLCCVIYLYILIGQTKIS